LDPHGGLEAVIMTRTAQNGWQNPDADGGRSVAVYRL
jgi:hypothetical protein